MQEARLTSTATAAATFLEITGQRLVDTRPQAVDVAIDKRDIGAGHGKRGDQGSRRQQDSDKRRHSHDDRELMKVEVGGECDARLQGCGDRGCREKLRMCWEAGDDGPDRFPNTP